MRRELLGYLVAALALGGTKCVYDHGQRRAGVLSERLRVADSTAKAQTRALRSIDSAYRTDTAALGAALARYAAARQALSRRLATPSASEKVAHISDTTTPAISELPTAPIIDSSPDSAVVGALRHFVAEADSTIQACRSVVQTCEQRVAARDSLIGTLRRQHALTREQVRRDVLRKWGERAIWAGLVVMVAR